MRAFFLVIALVISDLFAFGQQTEFSVQAGGGLFSYGGSGAARETILYYGDIAPGYPSLGNPFGRSSGFSYSVSGQIQHITHSQFIYGAQAGYEWLTSRVAITGYSVPVGTSGTTSGYGLLRNEYINLHPFIGKRYGNQRVSLDVTAGVDLGFGLSGHERSQITGTTPSQPIIGDELSPPGVDIRPRLNLTGYYRAFGLTLGYSRGLTNYQDNPYSDSKIYSRMWRIGLLFRLSSQKTTKTS